MIYSRGGVLIWNIYSLFGELTSIDSVIYIVDIVLISIVL